MQKLKAEKIIIPYKNLHHFCKNIKTVFLNSVFQKHINISFHLVFALQLNAADSALKVVENSLASERKGFEIQLHRMENKLQVSIYNDFIMPEHNRTIVNHCSRKLKTCF